MLLVACLAGSSTGAIAQESQTAGVTLTASAANGTFTAPATISLVATVSNPAGTVALVTFNANANVVAIAMTSPYTFTAANVPAGTYVVTATAQFSQGSPATSAPVTITVTDPQAPAAPAAPVAVTWPSNGTTFTAPANLTVQASGSAPAGLSSLAVYAGATLIGSGASSPISVAWNNVAAGAYSLTAVATDTTGASVRSAAVSVTVAAPIVSSGVDPTTWPLVQAGNLHYVGGFRLPNSSNNGAFDFGGAPMTYNPANNSLFVGNFYNNIAEVSIPTPVNSPVASDLPFAGYVQGFADPVEGHLSDIDSSGVILDGLLVSGGNLYGTAAMYYDANGIQSVSHYRRSVSLATPSFSGFNAIWQPTVADVANGVTFTGAGFASGYLATVPSAWQPLLGGSAITGQWGLAIVSRESFGPDAIVWDPAQLGAANGKSLLYYTAAHLTLGVWENTTANPVWGGADRSGGAALIDGTRTALFVGLHGLGAFCYGEGTADPVLAGTFPPDDPTHAYCYDPAGAGKGVHGYPYAYYVWAYDLNDLAAVKAGSKQPWQVVPYATWQLDLPTPDSSWTGIGGIGYDPAHQLLYVSQLRGDQDTYSYRPMIHVFKIQ